MNDYQNEQLEALKQVRGILPDVRVSVLAKLREPLSAYLQFRKETDRFLADHFSSICSSSCYRSQLSACCAKDTIITFFADVVINVLQTEDADLDRMENRLREDNTGSKCVYLTTEGCRWRVKPIVCQMFLCDRAQARAFGDMPALGDAWAALKEKKKAFTWPDRPVVLFDRIESLFIEAGCRSPLMYCHDSPGLLNVKRKAGLI